MKNRIILITTIVAFSINFSLNAQTQVPSDDKDWKFLIEPYLLFPSMSGTTGIRELPLIEVDANTSDIFSNLEFGAMLYLEAQTDKWAIGSGYKFYDID